MSFDGPALSIDDEGSILFDGEKIIVNVPAGHDLLEHFNWPENFEVEYTHPSHQQNQQPSQDAPSLDDNPVIIKEKAQAFNENVRQKRESARNKQSKSDSSRMESRPDFDQAKNDKGAQEALSDFEAAQENYFMAAGSIPNRIPEYCNLDVIRVKQDIETRPLIFQHCFRHSASQQDAMECIYAFPPDCDEDELRYLEQIADQKGQELLVAMAGGRVEDIGDEYQTADSETCYLELQEHVESEYGIEIRWGEGSEDTNRLRQLQNLDKGIAYIVDYLRREVYGDEQLALEAFQQYFGQSKDHGRLVIQLGSDAYFAQIFGISEEVADNYGFVPLGPGYSPEQLRSMYLGSEVDIPTIVHEFGHVVDRSLSIEDQHHESRGQIPAWIEWVEKTGLPLNDFILAYGIVGFAGKQNANEEFWADLFMTAVLDSIIGGPLMVYSSTHGRIMNLVGREFDACRVQVDGEVCEYLPVKWVEPENYRIANYTVLPKDQFPILLRSLLSG